MRKTLRSVLIAFLVGCIVLPAANAQTAPGILYRFQGPPNDGAWPYAGLISDEGGNLYGTTMYGGTGSCPNYLGNPGCGTVFVLRPPSHPGGDWRASVLYSFQGGNDGAVPVGGLVRDAQANLYGTTEGGGASSAGTVFRLTPPANLGGAWTETILYSFMGNPDGALPEATLIFDPAGNLYGTTISGGDGYCSPWAQGNCGTVFRLSPPNASNGSWQEQVLYSFNGRNGLFWDGSYPTAPLVFDKQGNLYGTTTTGGDCGYNGLPLCGTVFELSPPTTGANSWSETVLYSFIQYEYGPAGGLILDAQGNLYGTTVTAGDGDLICTSGLNSNACGTFFKLAPPSRQRDSWTQTVLYEFPESLGSPFGALLPDHKGSYVSTTAGDFSSHGTVFMVSPPSQSGESWTHKTIRKFVGGIDGQSPYGPLVYGKHGALYGTTEFGGEIGGPAFCGSIGCGTVFKIVLPKD